MSADAVDRLPDFGWYLIEYFCIVNDKQLHVQKEIAPELYPLNTDAARGPPVPIEFTPVMIFESIRLTNTPAVLSPMLSCTSLPDLVK